VYEEKKCRHWIRAFVIVGLICGQAKQAIVPLRRTESNVPRAKLEHVVAKYMAYHGGVQSMLGSQCSIMLQAL